MKNLSSMPVCQWWQYTEIPHNRGFLFTDSMGAKWVWCCIRVGYYFAKDLFRQAVNI